MSNLKTAYLPIDRAFALVRGEALPEHTSGAALFADISGFTPLTEALRTALGERRGAEELTRHLNVVYEALVAEVNRFGGSVIVFSGDAITCWFENRAVENEAESAVRAIAAALAMQNAMSQFAAIPLPDGSTTTLAIKIAIASGMARRFVVGDPAIQLIDVLAGATIARMANAESLANRGEILLDAATAQAADPLARLADWRIDPTSNERFAVLTGLNSDIAPAEWPDPNSITLADDLARAWLLPAINAHLDTGQGEFLTELRPVVAIFVRFGGVDYEHDPHAGAKLDNFVQRVQTILARYDAILLQLTLGDKGSYLYAVLGTPIAHEDDAHRAIHAALEMQTLSDELPFLDTLQIGITQGIMRTGTYGSSTRRTYGALGDEVNLAARLMQAAAPGQTLVSERIQTAVRDTFNFDALPPLRLKGKADLLTVFALVGSKTERHLRLQEPTYSLPMIGRTAELNAIAEKIDRVLQGQGQVVGITAEAGMGKSRLVAEVIRLTERRGLHGYGGECQSYGTNSAYLVWQSVWRGLFEIDPSAALSTQQQVLHSAIESLAPNRLNALPLLGQILNIPLPDNDFTQTLEPRYRKSALEALLLDCIKAAAHQASQQNSALLIVLEDLHWIDPASHDLLEMIARAIPNLPVLMVLAYRPPELQRIAAPRVESLPHFSKIELAELTPAEAEQLIRAKLQQRLPASETALPPALIEAITTRAQGNPFYSEELINFLLDRGLDPFDTAVLKSLEWPTSLHNLILSRIDQLSEAQKTTLKVASIIGRLFKFGWLYGYYPALGAPDTLKTDLDQLARLDITPLDTPEPEMAYLFKHIVTREVTYESLAYATRASLHEQFAAFLETQRGDDPDQFLDLLAYHYDHSDNLPKKRHYLWQAGQAAMRRFANADAIDYFSRALEIADDASRYDLLLAREQVYEVVANRDGQRQDLAALQEIVTTPTQRITLAIRQGKLALNVNEVAAANGFFQTAYELTQSEQDHQAEIELLQQFGEVQWRLGNLEEAETYTQQSLTRGRELGDIRREASCLTLLGRVAVHRGAMDDGRTFFEQALALNRQRNDKASIAPVLNNLGNVALMNLDYPSAVEYYRQSYALRFELGNRLGMATVQANLGMALSASKAHEEAWQVLEASRQLFSELGDAQGTAAVLAALANDAAYRGDHAARLTYVLQAVPLYRQIEANYSLALELTSLASAHTQLDQLVEARATLHEALEIALQVNSVHLLLIAIGGAAELYIRSGQPRRAAELDGFLVNHPDVGEEQLYYVNTERRPQVEAALSTEEMAAALERAKLLDLETVINELLAELEAT